MPENIHEFVYWAFMGVLTACAATITILIGSLRTSITTMLALLVTRIDHHEDDIKSISHNMALLEGRDSTIERLCEERKNNNDGEHNLFKDRLHKVEVIRGI